MEKYYVSRKVRRKAEQNKLASAQLKKGTTVLSSALVVSSIAAPLAAPRLAEAAEDTSVSAEVEYSTSQSSTDTVQEDTSKTEAPITDNQTQQTISDSETVQSTTDTSSAEEAAQVETPEKEDAMVGAAVAAFSARSVSSDPSVFIAEIAGHAQSVAAANDLYASVMMAQAILESDWGRSTLSTAPNYNLFGIKGSYQGQSVTMKTWEVLNGQWVQVNAAFRKYPSYSESFADNAYVLRNTSFQSGVYFYSGAWKSNTNSYKDATAWLTGRYATDPTYNSKLNTIIATYNLTQYDTPASGGNTGGNTNNNNGSNAGSTTGSNSNTGTTGQEVTHTVKSGDSLWLLAQQYGTTIANIKSWNNLSGDVIYVGQKLIVGKGANNSTSNNTSSGNTNTGGSTTGNSSTSGSNTVNTYYTVKSGDSLWAIANANGVSITNLRQWNNISGDIIYPGQRLVVKQGTTAGGSTNNTTNGNNSNSGSSTNTSSNASSTYYTVKSGDSLWAIANANGVSIANLRQWNSISGDIIYPGQRLVVKNGSTTNGSAGTSSNNSANNSSTNTNSTAGSSYYTVKSGDSLWVIANANGVSIANLRQWNNISGDIIYPGQRLVVKKGSANTSSSASASQSTTQTTTGTHKVKSGDTLWGLSQTYGTSIQKIKQLNGLSSDLIYIGQALKVK